MRLLLETTRRTSAGLVSFRELAPSLPLQPYVACFWHGIKPIHPAARYLHRVLPDGCADIIFDCHPTAPSAVVIGPMCRSRVVSSGADLALGVRFFPGVAPLFLDSPLTALQECAVSLNAFHLSGINRLFDQLLASPGITQKIAQVESWLESRLRRPRSDPHVLRTIKWTYAERGRLQVRDLVRAVGICERPLCSKFPAWTGYTPKQFVRVMRFQHAMESLVNSTLTSTADLAAAHGYSDQAHMIRDFQEFSGQTPGAVSHNLRSPDAECPIFSIPTPATLRYHRES